MKKCLVERNYSGSKDRQSQTQPQARRGLNFTKKEAQRGGGLNMCHIWYRCVASISGRIDCGKPVTPRLPPFHRSTRMRKKSAMRSGRSIRGKIACKRQELQHRHSDIWICSYSASRKNSHCNRFVCGGRRAACVKCPALLCASTIRSPREVAAPRGRRRSPTANVCCSSQRQTESGEDCGLQRRKQSRERERERERGLHYGR